MTSLPVGKLPTQLLEKMLASYAMDDPRVVVGPRIGEDAAVIDFGDRYLVAKTDPITFATDEIGWYAVNVNANDIACCGATPRWFLATLLLPETGTTAELVESIFAQLAEACRQLGVTLCGGHTEITYGLDRPIIVGQMLGETTPDRLVTSGGAQPGDVLILTKGIAVEGTSLIAREKRSDLTDILSAAEIDRCANFLYQPGIGIVRDAQLALESGGVHALHDPTEGGTATGLWELAQAAEVGVFINEADLPILPECDLLCQHFSIDALGLIASGSLLISAEANKAEAIIERLKSGGIAAAVIGSVVPQQEGCSMRSIDGTLRSLPVFKRDEITRLFEG